MAVAWRLAKSLEVLRGQVNAAYPNRNKASDGTIGDAAHQAQGSASDHNPNADGVVTALDITHDPKSGCDVKKLADAIAASRDARVKYLIFNDYIMVPSDYGWKWVYHYAGSHRSHLHISVWGSYDSTAKWSIGGDKVQRLINKNHLTVLFRQFVNRAPTAAEYKDYLAKGTLDYALNKLHPARNDLGKVIGERDRLSRELATTNAQLAEALDKAATVDEVQSRLNGQIKRNEQLLAQQQQAEATGRSFMQWLGSLFNK